MTLDVVFHPEAQLELEEAGAFYDDQRLGLGSDFLEEVERALRAVVERPEASPVDLGATRKFVLPRFPYSIMYSIEADFILVSAVAHHSRRHRYWRDRI